MDAETRKQIVAELAETFGGAKDVTPEDGQPLHVLLPSLGIPSPWKPSPARGIAKFEGWPDQRPLFWIDMSVVNAAGQPPRSNNPQLVLGETWRQFSFNFSWPIDPLTAKHALLKWLTRFREAS